jgi:hypothetical protein
MGVLGRDEKQLVGRLVEALERSADASEKLLSIAEQEQLVMTEPGPPVCPNCGKVNPTVTQLEADGAGPLGEFVMVAECHHCNRTIYAVPIGFDTVTTKELAGDVLNQRRAGA